MQLDRDTCDRARRSRDARFDGRFFIGVTTTRVYCRPICPARAPKDAHVRYFPSAAAAQAAGFRPCLRCRPEAAPGTAAWIGTSAVVSRALRLINDGALDREPVETLADRTGITARHLRRLFLQHLGATPHEVALTRRVHFAKKLLDETHLSCRDVASAAGFGSVRRFNDEIRRVYRRTPSELRNKARRPAVADTHCYAFTLAYRPPYDWDALLRFLGARATPGVEAVTASRYVRTISLDGKTGSLDIAHDPDRSALKVSVRFPDSTDLLRIIERVRSLFDVAADPLIVGEQLGVDALLRPALAAHPGIRVPGAWDGFELAVRAILGQQISVTAATTVAGRLAAMFGSSTRSYGPVDRLFPNASELANAPIERAGVIATRATAIRALARQVVSGHIRLEPNDDERSTMAALSAIHGIGDWTAQYVAMRAFRDPDACPHGDLVLRQMVGARTARELCDRAERWRPWRAYAVLLLWHHSHDQPSSRRGVRARDRARWSEIREAADREIGEIGDVT